MLLCIKCQAQDKKKLPPLWFCPNLYYTGISLYVNELGCIRLDLQIPAFQTLGQSRE